MWPGVRLWQEFDVDNRDGHSALERVYKDIIGTTTGPMPNVEVTSIESLLSIGIVINRLD